MACCTMNFRSSALNKACSMDIILPDRQEKDGAHTWDYWDIHVQEAIAFHCKQLKI